MRRRRKTRYTWFPQLGDDGSTEDLSTTQFGVLVTHDTSGDPGEPTIVPLLPDAPSEEAANDLSVLTSVLTQEYILKRIVGKIHIASEPRSLLSLASNLQPTTVRYTAGIFVARADGGTNANNPVGATTAADARINYGPANLSTTREPWIWRRSWILGVNYFNSFNQSTDFTTSGLALASFYPFNNLHGSVADGPHVDAKTARRVGNDDRLFFAVQAQALAVVGVNTPTTQQDKVFVDLRFLGAPRRPKSRSAF